MKKNNKLFSQQDLYWIKASHGNILNSSKDNKKLITDEKIDFLKENGIITNISPPIVGEFKPIVDCLQSDVLLNTQKNDSSSYLSMNELCSGKFQEVFADWWSRELTNYYLEKTIQKNLHQIRYLLTLVPLFHHC